jgi:hypothetical protein
MKNNKLLLNNVFNHFLIKLLVYNYIKTSIWINCIFMVYIIFLIVKAQINYIWYLKEFKMSEILCVNTFDIIFTSNFNTKCAHYTIEISVTFFQWAMTIIVHNFNRKCSLSFICNKTIQEFIQLNLVV